MNRLATPPLGPLPAASVAARAVATRLSSPRPRPNETEAASSSADDGVADNTPRLGAASAMPVSVAPRRVMRCTSAPAMKTVTI